ncbi:hypothetical protein ACFL6I_04495 [candidate division KSB1 bacterium]
MTHQPPAGKLMYRALLSHNNILFRLPENNPVVIRFRGDVPPFILIPHSLLGSELDYTNAPEIQG